jgi:hypothetical protein
MAVKLSGIDHLIRTLPGAAKYAMEQVGKEAVNIAKQEAPGKLGDTVQYRIKGKKTIELYSTAPYAIYVEKGRPGFSVRNKKALRFVIGGQVIFCTHVGPSKPNPFMGRTRKRLKDVFQEVFERSFFHYLK